MSYESISLLFWFFSTKNNSLKSFNFNERNNFSFACFLNSYKDTCNIQREFYVICSPERIGVHVYPLKIPLKKKRFLKEIKALLEIKIMCFWINYSQEVDLLTLWICCKRSI